MSKAAEQINPELEIEYKAGIKSVNALAKEYEIAEPTLRRMAKRKGWVRNPSGVKRAIVNSHFAGVTEPLAKKATNRVTKSDEVRQAIVEAGDEDIEDMQMALMNARQCLRSLGMFIGGAAEAKELKTLLEANGLAMEQIRRIRGLDEPKKFDELEALKILVDARWLPKDLLVAVGEHYGKLKPNIKTAFQARMVSHEAE